MRRSILGLLILVLMASMHAQDVPMFELVTSELLPYSATCENFLDLDNNGLIDILALDTQLFRYEQSEPCGSTFILVDSDFNANAFEVHPNNIIISMSVTDLDSDGLVEILTTEQNLETLEILSYRYEQSSPNSSDFPLLSSIPGQSFGLRYIDVDQNGQIDIVNPKYQLNNPGAFYQLEQDISDCELFDLMSTNYMGFEFPWGMAPLPDWGNLDDDDMLDMIVCLDWYQTWDWYEQQSPSMEFEWKTELDIEASGQQATLFDFNNDGYDDLYISGMYDRALFQNNYIDLLENEEEAISISSSIIQNTYPNPFNPETTISLDIAQGEHADLTIYNTRGQKVKSWKNLPSGEHQITWDGKNLKGTPVSSGIYMVILKTANRTVSRKISLIK